MNIAAVTSHRQLNATPLKARQIPQRTSIHLRIVDEGKCLRVSHSNQSFAGDLEIMRGFITANPHITSLEIAALAIDAQHQAQDYGNELFGIGNFRVSHVNGGNNTLYYRIEGV